MRLRDRRALEGALRAHYRAAASADDKNAPAPQGLIAAVAHELVRPARPGALGVVAEQARRVGIAAWALHAALVLLVVAMELSGAWLAPATGPIGAALALASLAEVTRSRSCGMAELEASCAVNAQVVACSRALVLGCADALALTALVLLAANGPGVWLLLAQACAPYLAAVGAGLLAARRVASADATAAAVGAAAGVCAICVVLRALCPSLFEPATGLAWLGATASALAFAIAEARAWLRATASAFADDSACASAAC